MPFEDSGLVDDSRQEPNTSNPLITDKCNELAEDLLNHLVLNSLLGDVRGEKGPSLQHIFNQVTKDSSQKYRDDTILDNIATQEQFLTSLLHKYLLELNVAQIQTLSRGIVKSYLAKPSQATAMLPQQIHLQFKPDLVNAGAQTSDEEDNFMAKEQERAKSAVNTKMRKLRHQRSAT